jgi:hypothetical protein
MVSEQTKKRSNRQHKSSNNEQERLIRQKDARELGRDFIGGQEEYFKDPANRLEFIGQLDADEFFNMARYANAVLRSEDPDEMEALGEKGSSLPMLHTPSVDDKPAAFRNGFKAIQEYIGGGSDSLEKKIEGVSMAIEALIIWTHAFDDGNGRASRFLASLIENGGNDIDKLVRETASTGERGRSYGYKGLRRATREGWLKDANNSEIMLDDEERAEMRREADGLPNDIDAMYLDIKRLLENDDTRDIVLDGQRKVLARKAAYATLNGS